MLDFDSDSNSNIGLDSSSSFMPWDERNCLDKDLLNPPQDLVGTLVDSDLGNFDNFSSTVQDHVLTDLNLTEQAVQISQEYLSGLEKDPDLIAKLELAFGKSFDRVIAEKLINDFAQDDFSAIPTIKIVSSATINGASGGYDSLNGLIYLSREFVTTHQDEPGAIADVVLEEIGHFLDARINEVDAVGDEGELFSALVQYKTLSALDIATIKAQDDTGVININGQEVEIEYATDPNGTRSTADRLGTLNNSRRGTGNIGFNESYGRDRHDYWKFSLDSTHKVSLNLTEGSQNADIAVYNSFGKLLKYSGKSLTQWLGKGDYYALVYNYSNPGTSYKVDVTASTSLNDYISDYSVRNAVDTRLSDGFLDRQDMISILNSSKDYGSVNGQEVNDLRRIVGDAKLFAMEDHVKVLSSKVVNGNAANQNYQGATLGNLYAGSTSTHMGNLVNKWFYGSDRPTIGSELTYQFTKGLLFQDGISYTDARQGGLGDCYYIASLATTAFSSPSKIQDMFIDNGDNTYTVRFFNNGVADYVTVDRYLPTKSSGYLAYATRNQHYDKDANELWVALAEKAYAQINEAGWIAQDGNNSYLGIEGGWSKDSINHITGINTTQQSIDIPSIINTFNSNHMVTLTSNYDSKKTYLDPNDKFVGNHVYVMTGYNSTTNKFTLYNPWGHSIEATHDQIKTYFRLTDTIV